MRKEAEHGVLIIPGLNDIKQQKLYGALNYFWNDSDFGYSLCCVDWHDGENFLSKQNKLIVAATKLLSQYSRVSVVGVSAGGSAAFNLFCEMPDKLYKAVNVGGRLRPGTNLGFRGFDRRTETSIAFRESVILFSEKEKYLEPEKRQRLMTLRPIFGDELVPSNTVILGGAVNSTIPFGEHLVANASALTFFSLPIKRFLKE